jgi:Probable taurine catabolism dioxygenase
MTTAQLSLDVKPIAGAIGAEIHGVDLTAPLSDDDIQAIRAVWLDHGVVFFRNQPLEPGAFQAFAERFGDVVEYPFVKGIPDHPMIIPVLKLPHEKHNFGGIWHTDTAYLAAPPMATMLIARELPLKGGDTLFASGYAAYEALSEALKRHSAHSKRPIARPKPKSPKPVKTAWLILPQTRPIKRWLVNTP